MLVILGATASGKSALAMQLARASGAAEILSVDSMQVYRGMDVGTAKPTPAERAELRHHLIDAVDPQEVFTVARFVELADAAITDAASRGIPLIATGGTPLYYKALFHGLFEGPGADESVRARLREQPNDELHRRLTSVDPAAAARIHVNDNKRLVRALEVYELTGRPISSFQTHWDSPATSRYNAEWVGLHWETEALNRRINARVKEMMVAGWLAEVQSLRTSGGLSSTAAEATGYRELIDHLEGRSTLEDAVEQIKIATRQLARRQMKWFRRFPDVKWVAGDQPLDKITDEVRAWRASRR